MEIGVPLQAPLARTRIPLGSLLLRDGLLSAEQLEQALAEKDESGRRLGEIVLARGWVSPAALAMLLAEQHHLEFVDLGRSTSSRPPPGCSPRSTPAASRRCRSASSDDEAVLVAVADPTNVVASDDLRLALRQDGIRLALAGISSLDEVRRVTGDRLS